MRFAFVIFDGMTALDLVGAYDPLTRLRSMGFMPDLQWNICAHTPAVADDRGLPFTPNQVGEPLGGYDLVVVPGGFATRRLVSDPSFIDWIRTAETAGIKASVCTGALLLGAAGFLQGRRATTHPSAFNELGAYCAAVDTQSRVVDEGSVVTARGVTAALDLGLHLVERLAGPDTRNKIQLQMDYQASWKI